VKWINDDVEVERVGVDGAVEDEGGGTPPGWAA